MSQKLNWEANKRRQAVAAVGRPTQLPEDPEKIASQLHQHNRKAGVRGYTTRGAQTVDAYARRNYSGPITLPRLKFLEGK